ncbi:hypothetical protein N7512_004487 [Penicillium capsulatum]|nr:hypothetical protein N7512_004487 [Penicillium capsulatum]
MATSRISPLRPSIRLSPAHSRETSRSTSPDRHAGSLYQKIDPLLSNLSPESTLSALTSTEAVPSNETFSRDNLSHSISQVSPAERALGIRAAIAAQNLNLWYKEVQSWTWPKQVDAKAGKGFIPPVDSRSSGCENVANSSSLLSPDAGEVEYYGSLPADIVAQYEQRIEEIRDGMENLDVEELKEHVLNAHIPSRSRPSSATSTVSVPPPLSYVQLSDFTAVVTATILRALPFLSRLGSLLTTWDVRLLVLRQIPGLLRELISIRSALDSSLSALRNCQVSRNIEPPFPVSYLRDEHAKLESAVVAVGRRMDRVLDALEGRADSLPEEWIDDLEKVESDFAAWVVEAERYKLRLDWISTKDRSESPPQEMHDSLGVLDKATPEPEPSSPSPKERDIYEKSESSPDQGHLSEPSFGVVVAEDVRTPTQPNYIHYPAGTPEQSPTRVPLPVTPDVNNKENIPPPGYIPAQILLSSPREPTPKPAPLTERDSGDDPFIQKPNPPAMGEPGPAAALGSVSGVSIIEGNSHTGLKSEETPNDTRRDPKETSNIEMLPQLSSSLAEPETPNAASEVSHDVSIKSSVELGPGEPIRSNSPTSYNTPTTGAVRTTDACGLDGAYLEKTPPRKSEHVHTTTTGSTAYQGTSKPEKHAPEQPSSSRKPLQSPIKLGKVRSGKSNPQPEKQKLRSRRPSTGSIGSLHSDDSSLVSASKGAGPTTDSSDDVHCATHSRPGSRQPTPILFNSEHMLREDRLRRLESTKAMPSTSLQQTRAVSLPLERFIMDLSLEDESAPKASEYVPSDNTVARAKLPTKSTSTTIPPIPRRPGLTRGKSASNLKASDQAARSTDYNGKAFGRNTALRAMQHQDQPKSARLRKRLTAHPSLESLGVKRQELTYVEEDEAELMGSRASSPNMQSRKPKDQMDEKISSILNTLPGRIHLVDPNNEADTSSSSSSLDRKMRDRYLSESPHGPSRSMTPAPSLTLMPASRRRSSHAHKMEDSYVKLYHLHHGGQAAPTKLFVRTVGEDGKRVMVRVGGGWADLGEYLREYVIHHGRRKVSETPRVEVQGLKTRSSPGYPSPGNTAVAAPSSYVTAGRATPSRPPSVLSARPPSSLTVHKKRRGSNASDVVASRSVTTGTLNSFTSPPVAATGRRRLSVSSGFSVDTHSPAHTIGASPHDTGSTPLGLAGPKPRSRQISMSPEGEAWVEDVLQKTRRTSSLNPPPFPLNVAPDSDEAEHHDRQDRGLAISLPKVRSVSDIDSFGTGTGKRVFLRGLGNHR